MLSELDLGRDSFFGPLLICFFVSFLTLTFSSLPTASASSRLLHLQQQLVCWWLPSSTFLGLPFSFVLLFSVLSRFEQVSSLLFSTQVLPQQQQIFSGSDWTDFSQQQTEGFTGANLVSSAGNLYTFCRVYIHMHFAVEWKCSEHWGEIYFQTHSNNDRLLIVITYYCYLTIYMESLWRSQPVIRVLKPN